jgi:hypothetical protein
MVFAALPEVAAAAATYHVAPTGSGTACTVAAPCELEHAVGVATAGDTILAAGDAGTYGSVVAPSPAPIRVEAEVTLEGEPGQPMPQLYTDAQGEYASLELEREARLVDFAVHERRSGELALLVEPEASAERVLSVNEAGGAACQLVYDTTMTNSACAGTYGIEDNFGAPGTYTIKLRDDTFFGIDYGVEMTIGSMNLDVEAVNTIFLGESADARIEGVTGGEVTITASHSNYSGVIKVGTKAGITPEGTAGNQTAAPLLADPKDGNFHELVGSPTINAGLASPSNGKFDLEGNDRELPATINCSGPGPAVADIGAYEFVAAEPTCAPTGTSGSNQQATSTDTQTTNAETSAPAPRPGAKILSLHVSSASATLRFKGTSGAKRFECRLDRGKWRSCHSPAVFPGLKPGTHQLGVKAVGPAGGDFAAPVKRRFHIAP